MSNALQLAGSQSRHQTRFAPIYTNRFFQGLWTQRNPLRDAGSTRLEEKYIGTRGDGLIDGSNVELTNRLTLARRPGCSVYNNNVFPTINSFFEFRQFTASSETISVIADTAAAVIDVTGPSTNNILFVKSTSGQTFFQNVGNTLYFGNGSDQKKYLTINGGRVVQDWGISSQSNQSSGQATAGTDLPYNGTLSIAWNNPNAVSTTNQFASVQIPGNSVNFSDMLLASGFPINLPQTLVVTGVQVTFTAYASAASAPPLGVFLYNTNSSSSIGLAKQLTSLTASATSYTLGGPNDDWGVPFTMLASLFTGISPFPPSFRLGFVVNPTTVTSTVFVGGVSITVYVSSAPGVTISGNGSFTATQGYQYVYAYGNSNTGHISTPTAASTNTGAFSNANNANISVLASTDPQVNQIRVFRTEDGGSTFFELPTSPYANLTSNITDNALDASLQIFNIAPVPNGTTIPVGNNDPPPAGLINLTYYLSRVWGSVANTVYYSRTVDGTVGVPAESFPALNYFVFPSYVVRMVPTVLGIFVFTKSDIYIITGNGTSNSPLVSSPFLMRVGLQSYNALTVNGTTIYLMTSDGQVISLDPGSGVSEVGFPIGDLLQENFDPAGSYLTWHVAGSADKALYVGDGASGWFRMSPTSAPETGLTWSPFATITGGCQCIQSVEINPGQYNLLIGPGSTGGPILFRDTQSYLDNGQPYEASATIGSLVLAQPSQMAELLFVGVDATAVGSRPAISVLIDEVSGQFQPLVNWVNDPPMLTPSRTIYGARYYFAQNASVTAWCRHLQIKFDWPTENAANEVLSYTLVGAHWAE